MQDEACLVIGMTTYCFGHGDASVALTHNNRWLLHVTIHVHVAASCVYNYANDCVGLLDLYRSQLVKVQYLLFMCTIMHQKSEMHGQ